MSRYASIDVGTNAVLMLVAERGPAGRFISVRERSGITRLGRGVDATGLLAPEGMEDTLRVLEAFAAEARTLGAQDIVVSATSAARDARNGMAFLEAAQARAGVQVEILTGDTEARLSYRAAADDFAPRGEPLVVLDVGGGSTEVIYGHGSAVSFRKSFDVGSVRLTERVVRQDPPSSEERDALSAAVRAAFTALPPRHRLTTVVGLAGTVTTVYAISRSLADDDMGQIQGGTLRREELAKVTDRLFTLPLTQRRALTGLHPKRADVICAGALILLLALQQLGANECRVSDRGLRWGLLAERFGEGP